MSAITPAEPLAASQPAPIVQKPAKPPHISPKIKKAVNLLADGSCKTQKAAAERIGVSEAYLSVQLNKPHVRAFFARRAAENIDRAQLRASVRLVELIDAQSEHVAAKVSERILENAGVLKVQQGGVSVSVNTTISAGYVIDLAPSQQPQPAADMKLIEAEAER